jgi:hypothetical protein
VRREVEVRYIPNWTSVAGALEGVLEALGTPLPRHAVMGLSGHAFTTNLGREGGVIALPSGPLDLDWETAVGRYSRLGWRWERFGARLAAGTDWTEAREAAIAWARRSLDAGRPLVGFDFHLREFGVVRGYDDEARAWIVDDLLAADYGPMVSWDDWPGAAGWIELYAPVAQVESDPVETIAEALQSAGDLLLPPRGEPGGLEGVFALETWAEALDTNETVDRAGNAYTLAVLLAARSDGAAFLADLAESLPELSGPLTTARDALRDEAKALAPLTTLFPFPSGGHGNVDVPGLRRAAAMALRQAARAERAAAAAIEAAVGLLE